MPSKKRIEKQADIFARAIHDGKSQRQAFRESHPGSKSSEKGMDEQGCKWAHSDKVLTRLAELQRQAEDNAIISDLAAQAELSNIALDDSNDARARIAALDQLAKRQGCYIEKHEVNGGMKIDLEQARRDAWNALTDA